ncbi:hypothetical protein V5740_14490 (plasmid) [Croceibacterium sp. TMG7-5b_MA50]|uniref:hypothetical protein n=1 Tax=Croceibacterium sp. TMG7-5b_MA50 TaxID=3121290 RepID=UPI0032221784
MTSMYARAIGVRRAGLVLGTSMVAIGAACASPALAQCAPDPTVAGGTTTCTGIDGDGVIVDTPNSTVDVVAGAQVAGQVTVAIPQSNSYSLENATINVAGSVDGGSAAGILGIANPASGPFSYEGTRIAINVAAGGVVTGTNGIATSTAAAGGNPSTRMEVSLDNAGAISGTAGVAIQTDGATQGTVLHLTNRAGGTIGAIRGTVGRFDNAGIIDGGSVAAVDTGATTNYAGPKTNSGTIRTNSSEATLRHFTPDYTGFANTGTVINTGSGAALYGDGVLVDNGAGGIITGGSDGIAIDANAMVRVTNRGRIEGDIVVRGTGSAYFPTSTIDSVDGVIAGDVILGGTNDYLIARYNGVPTLQTGITGTIDGGAGTDLVAVRIDGDTLIDGRIDLFTGFEQLSFDVGQGATVTLGTSFAMAAPTTITITGQGSAINRGTVEGVEQALVGNGGFGSTITNEGTIRTTRAGTVGVFAAGGQNFVNTGLIDAAGNGLASGGSITNSGTIIAGGTGAANRGLFTNSGTIRSTGGIGADLSPGSWMGALNSGLIEGRTVGVQLGGTLANSGTIRSDGTGVTLDWEGHIVNLAGGIITGGTQAIGITPDRFASGVSVSNAGTINGDVNLPANVFGGSGSYHAQDGGVLNGNLTLGAGGLLETNIVNTGPGRFAGITGTVTTTDATLLYRVTSDVAAVHRTEAGFRSVGYNIAEGARLVLTGDGTAAQTLALSGGGSVDLDVDIATTGRQLISMSSYVPGINNPPVLDVISRGDLTMERPVNDFSAAYTAVQLTGQTFTNAGTITVRQTGTAPVGTGDQRPRAISGSFDRIGTVINNGTINLAGGVGVTTVAALTNTGSIVQVAGSASAAVRQVDAITNSGTIRTDDVAVLDMRTLVNLTGGTIASTSGTAIRSSSGHVGNAGTITGTVDLGYAVRWDGQPMRSYGTGSYIAAGGTVTGDVLFGDAADLFVMTGDATGVTGTVDGAGGDDILLHRRATNASVTLGLPAGVVNFQRFAVEAAAADATVTVTGGTAATGDLLVGGVGTVANRADIAGAITTWSSYIFYDPATAIATSLARLENSGAVSGGVRGDIASFTNTGSVTVQSDSLFWRPDYGVAMFGDGPLVLNNAGSIGDGRFGAVSLATTAGATLVNTGTIAGDVVFSDYPAPGNDRVENRGTIDGLVFLGQGDDVFVQGGAAQLGMAVGGAGNDLFVVDADKAGAINAGQFIGFERLMQTGTQAVTYLGAFSVPTIELAGGTLVVAAGGAIGTTGAMTVTGGDAGVSVINRGRIAGGGVQFGAGSDFYWEGAGSSVAYVDGGAGRDTYGVLLSGDRQGIGARSGFERLAVDGPGTLTLTPDQNWAEIALAGANLSLATGAFTVDAITGSDRAEQVMLTGDVPSVSLGGGDDLLTLPAATLAGRYDGGAGSDALRLMATGTQVLTGSVRGFETITLAADTLRVAGTLGQAGDVALLAGTVRQVQLVDGGTIAGTLDLGTGDSLFTVAAGGTVTGTVAGGAGNDTARFDLSRALTLNGRLTGFELVETRGTGVLTLAGSTNSFSRLDLTGDLVIAPDAALTAERVVLGAGARRMTIAGRFAGNIVGTGNDDVVTVSGGSAAAPVAFAGLDNIAALQMTGGFATVAGRATAGTIGLTGGRLVGLAGSTITAGRIDVGQGATFGSAGTVRANIAVAGTISPGASPGTMNVVGDVALAGTSRAVFEIAPAQSDRLVIDGALTIAPGATLELVATDRVLPGQSLDLITTTRGITGSFTSVVKSADLFGFILQDADTIRLLGQFLDDAAFTPQVSGTIAYVNDLLTSGLASPALLSAAPLLVNAQGGTDAAAFARIAPQAYATASQISVDQGLELARLARSGVLASPAADGAGPYTFASVLGRTGEVGGDDAGIAQARGDGHGVLGGIGWAGGGLSLGAFVGWTDNRQTLRTLGARTEADGVVAGVHARWRGDRGTGVSATIAYDGQNATTTRAVAAGDPVGRYDLTAWTGDIQVDHAVPLAGGWTLRPSVGATFIRARGDAVAEGGSSPFALAVARRRQDWTFVDGAVDLRADPARTLRPWVNAGVRYRVDGSDPFAVAALAGGPVTLRADGAGRAPVTAILGLGADVALSRGVTLFGSLNGEAGRDVANGTAQAGLRAAF